MSRLGSFLSPPASCLLPPASCPLLVLFPHLLRNLAAHLLGARSARFPVSAFFILRTGRGGWSGAVFALGSREREEKKKNSDRRFARRSLAEAAASAPSYCVAKRDTELELRFGGGPDHFEAKGILTIT